MVKPLYIPLPPQPAYSSWTKIHDWGVPTADGSFTDHLRLQDPADTWIRAACDGVLSLRSNAMPMIGTPYLFPWVLGSYLPPSTVSLYLNTFVPVGTASGLNLRGFLYRNLETSSLATALASFLETVVIGGDPLTPPELVMMLLQGLIDVPVIGGAAIGLAARASPGGPRELGFSAYDVLGLRDPLRMLDVLRDSVADGQPAVDQLLAALPPSPSLFEPGLTVAQLMTRATSRLYPWSALNEAREQLQLTPAEWRQLGDRQKSIYRERLRVRAGHGGASTQPPFELNDTDLHNLFQLEAVTEFYANFDDPWKPGTVPVLPGAPVLSGNAARSTGSWVTLDGAPALAGVRSNHDKIYLAASQQPSRTYRILEVDTAGHRVRTEGDPALPAAGASLWKMDPYQVVELLDPQGATAEPLPGLPTVLQLDGGADLTRALTRVWPQKSPVEDRYLYDTILLEGEQTRPKKRFRIVDVDPEARTVTVDAPPNLTQASSWRIQRRPWLICIDPIGGRLWGHDAALDPAVPGRINLPSADLSRLNPHFDTIYLPSDVATPRRTYRIHQVNATAKWVNVRKEPTDPVPSLSGPGLWHIQAGVSGNILALNYDIESANGYDHYDAAVFLVHGGEIRFIAPWSTYTSRNYSAYHFQRSSVRGNKDYEYSSYRSGEKEFINYALKVVDFGAGRRLAMNQLFDAVREGRWYFEEETRDDTKLTAGVPTGSGPGKTLIRFHHGLVASTASQSAGCIVSPKYTDLRSNLIQLYVAERVAFYPDGAAAAADADIARLIGIAHDDAESLWRANSVTFAEWAEKLVGWLWIIRPDERPL